MVRRCEIGGFGTYSAVGDGIAEGVLGGDEAGEKGEGGSRVLHFGGCDVRDERSLEEVVGVGAGEWIETRRTGK